jgi:acyl carrier protein phosphodiesterase
MNYLGHLLLSGKNHELMMANLYGDFFKGSHYEVLPEIVEEGVHLHRAIDSYIDHHPITRAVLKPLYNLLPKVAPIALDLFFDHLLAKNWSTYHSMPLDEFVADFFEFALNQEKHSFPEKHFEYPKEFIDLLHIIHSSQWLTRYQQLEGLEFACKGLSQRINFENNLHEGPVIFTENESIITISFHQYMKEAMERFGIQKN